MGKMMMLRSFKSPEDVKACEAVQFKDAKDGMDRMPGYAGKVTAVESQEIVAHTSPLQKQPTEPLPAQAAPLGLRHGSVDRTHYPRS